MARDPATVELRDMSGLVRAIAGDAERLIGQHAALVREEIREGLSPAPAALAAIGAGAGLVAAGGVLGSLMVVHGLHKSTRIPLWGCYGLVGGALAAAGLRPGRGRHPTRSEHQPRPARDASPPFARISHGSRTRSPDPTTRPSGVATATARRAATASVGPPRRHRRDPRGAGSPPQRAEAPPVPPPSLVHRSCHGDRHADPKKKSAGRSSAAGGGSSKAHPSSKSSSSSAKGRSPAPAGGTSKKAASLPRKVEAKVGCFDLDQGRQVQTVGPGDPKPRPAGSAGGASRAKAKAKPKTARKTAVKSLIEKTGEVLDTMVAGAVVGAVTGAAAAVAKEPTAVSAGAPTGYPPRRPRPAAPAPGKSSASWLRARPSAPSPASPRPSCRPRSPSPPARRERRADSDQTDPLPNLDPPAPSRQAAPAFEVAGCAPGERTFAAHHEADFPLAGGARDRGRACRRPGLQSPDIVLADFEGDDYGRWNVEGTAFGRGPARGTLPGQMAVEGFQGRGLVNSFFGGDGSTGTLTSPEFTINRKSIRFLIGGGGWADRDLHQPDRGRQDRPHGRPARTRSPAAASGSSRPAGT